MGALACAWRTHLAQAHLEEVPEDEFAVLPASSNRPPSPAVLARDAGQLVAWPDDHYLILSGSVRRDHGVDAARDRGVRPMISALYLIHAVDPDKLEAVKAEMRVRGAPRIRVVDCGDHYVALERCHRLTAAAALGIAPDLVVLAQDDLVEADSLDTDYFQAGETYTAGEIAGELHGMHSPVLTINSDGTLTA